MNTMKIAILSLIGGVVMTLLTGLVSNMPTPLVGAEHYGYPLPWLFRLILAPEYFPWRLDWVALIIDAVVWTVILAVVVFTWTKVRH